MTPRTYPNDRIGIDTHGLDEPPDVPSADEPDEWEVDWDDMRDARDDR